MFGWAELALSFVLGSIMTLICQKISYVRENNKADPDDWWKRGETPPWDRVDTE